MSANFALSPRQKPQPARRVEREWMDVHGLHLWDAFYSHRLSSNRTDVRIATRARAQHLPICCLLEAAAHCPE